MNLKSRKIAFAGLVAAAYVLLTGLSALLGLDKGAIQFRISEILTVLPFYSVSAVPGLFIGCILSGVLFGSLPLDIIFGSLTTLLAAALTFVIGRKCKGKSIFASLPPVMLNALIVPLILKYEYGIEGLYIVFAVSVFAGEFVSAGICGTVLLKKLPEKAKNILLTL